ncbi:MAG: hypothetical protein K5860_10715 [Bacteroidales bacterium]|nr:hypothetical protein [Bacteroidales bacterium]
MNIAIQITEYNDGSLDVLSASDNFKVGSYPDDLRRIIGESLLLNDEENKKLKTEGLLYLCFADNSCYVVCHKFVGARWTNSKNAWIKIPLGIIITSSDWKELLEEIKVILNNTIDNETKKRIDKLASKEYDGHTYTSEESIIEGGVAVRYFSNSGNSLYDILSKYLQKEYFNYKIIYLFDEKDKDDIKINPSVCVLDEKKYPLKNYLYWQPLTLSEEKTYGFKPNYDKSKFGKPCWAESTEKVTVTWKKEGYKSIKKTSTAEKPDDLYPKEDEIKKVIFEEDIEKLISPHNLPNIKIWLDDKRAEEIDDNKQGWHFEKDKNLDQVTIKVDAGGDYESYEENYGVAKKIIELKQKTIKATLFVDVKIIGFTLQGKDFIKSALSEPFSIKPSSCENMKEVEIVNAKLNYDDKSKNLRVREIGADITPNGRKKQQPSHDGEDAPKTPKFGGLLPYILCGIVGIILGIVLTVCVNDKFPNIFPNIFNGKNTSQGQDVTSSPQPKEDFLYYFKDVKSEWKKNEMSPQEQKFFDLFVSYSFSDLNGRTEQMKQYDGLKKYVPIVQLANQLNLKVTGADINTQTLSLETFKKRIVNTYLELSDTWEKDTLEVFAPGLYAAFLKYEKETLTKYQMNDYKKVKEIISLLENGNKKHENTFKDDKDKFSYDNYLKSFKDKAELNSGSNDGTGSNSNIGGQSNLN